MKTIEKKMRQQLFDADFNQLEDRLIAQDTELYKGPKSPHKGPIKIEVCLFEQEDVTNFITYLGKLVGNLPIEAKVKSPKKQAGDDTSGIHDTIIEKVKNAAQNGHQDDVLRILRELGFVCITTDDLRAATDTKITKEEEKLQWMVRLLREAKNPINNKYDTTVLYGFQLMGEKVPTFLAIEFNRTIPVECPWKSDKAYNFKKLNLSKFHPAMVEEERLKFSQELAKYRKLIKDGEKLPEAPTKLFRRWMPYVEFLEKEEFEKAWEVTA